MAGHGRPIELVGQLTNLSRLIRAKGGERIRFTVDMMASDTLWDRLKAHAEGDVAVTLVPQQAEFDDLTKDGPGRGVKPGSKAAEGSHQAQD